MDVTLEQVADQLADISKQLSTVEERLGAHVSREVESHVSAATRELKSQARIYQEEIKDQVKKAAEGYSATLERIERELTALNEKVDNKFSDHDLVIADHTKRIAKLEEHP
jgi:hypothetical protein